MPAAFGRRAPSDRESTNNILDNALSLISPLTGNLDFNGNKLLNLSAGTVGAPSLSFSSDSDTGIYRSAANTVDIAAGGVRSASFNTATTAVNYFDFTPSAASGTAVLQILGDDASPPLRIRTKGTGNISLRAGSTDMLTVTGTTSVDLGTNIPIVPAGVSGQPAANTLYRQSIIRGWCSATNTAGTYASALAFNVTSLTDGAAGIFTVTWEVDFANTDYVTVGAALAADVFVAVTTRNVGSTVYEVQDAGGTASETSAMVLALGNQ